MRTPEEEQIWQAARQAIKDTATKIWYSSDEDDEWDLIADAILALDEIEVRDSNQACEVSRFGSESRRLIHQNNLVKVIPK